METIDFSSPAFINDPYPTYRRLCDAESPYWLPHPECMNTKGIWLFSRYADAVEILKTPGHISKQISRVKNPEEITPLDLHMLNQDPPVHTRLRKLVEHVFAPKNIKAQEPKIEKIIKQLLNRVRHRSELDFVADFALPLPINVISELLGVPGEACDSVRNWTIALSRGYDSAIANESILQQQKQAAQESSEYLMGLVEERRRQPRNDLISDLVDAHDNHDAISMPELLTMCTMLLFAGHETTINLLSNGLLTLFHHPDQFELLKKSPGHLNTAIEEMLRFESPLQRSSFRVTAEHCVIGGKQLQQGEQVGAIIGAANRDPRQFPDPDRFDITRTHNRHLAFGIGIHMCLGINLARLEARIAFGQILEQMPNIRPASETPDWSPTSVFRRLNSLPVYTSAAG